MDRRHFLGSAGAAAFGQGAAPRPNILLILTDQQTHDAWSGASNRWLRTPAMDSLAARGSTFSNAMGVSLDKSAWHGAPAMVQRICAIAPETLG